MTTIKGMLDYLNIEVTKAYDNHDTGKAHELRRVLIKFKELAKKDLEEYKVEFDVFDGSFEVITDLKQDLEEVSDNG